MTSGTEQRGPSEIAYGSGDGSENTITTAEPGGVLQKKVALPDVAATYCLPATWYVMTPPVMAAPVLNR
jgi:hypothetical protein